MEKIGIFCSSSNRLDKVYYDEAARLGRWMGQHGKTLVCGGANCGLMETLATAVSEAGGRVVGVIPQILLDRHRVSTHLSEQILTRDLSERKGVLIRESDVILALPGSVGTLDEVFTVMAANTIGIHQKKIIFWNICGFWDDLFAMLDGLTRRNVVNKPWPEVMLRADSFDELVNLIASTSRTSG